MIAKLALEDGSIFTGLSIGAAGTRVGEVVFNTAMTGYQEVLTDPSYCGQIVCMTFPLIGNYGVNEDDFESARTFLSGFVAKQLPRRPSNFRATAGLAELLETLNVVGLAGVDTRALTRRIHRHGALRAALSTEVLDDLELNRMAQAAPAMCGANLVARVKPDSLRGWEKRLWSGQEVRDRAAADGAPHVVAIDCGIKHNILRYLADQGCLVTAVPGDISARALRELKPDALLAGNGPGDPAVVTETIDTLRSVIGEVPIFGVCLGHQLLALALGASTYKLRFGHHGANQPVRNVLSGRVEITSQNHGFAVDGASLRRVGGLVTHINNNDESIEGFYCPDRRVMAVQFHPEASPGPHDAGYLFGRFIENVRGERAFDESIFMPG